MTHEGAKNFIHALITFYPTSAPKTQNAMAEMIGLWEMALNGLDDELCQAALVAYVRTDKRGYLPTPGMVMDLVDNTTNGMTEADAWVMVRKAISRGAYHSEEDFAKFPEIVQKAVGSPRQIHDWAISSNFSESVVQSNFLKMYRNQVERRKQLNALPEKIRNSLLTNKEVLLLEEV